MRKAALVAGIGAYSGRWSALQNCVNDADQVAKTLEFPEYGYSVTKITDGEVTKPAIMRWLAETKNSGADAVTFYFAGHGVVNALGAFLVTHDNQEFDEGISLLDLMRLAEPSSGAETEVAIILDCCHAGEAVTVGAYTPRRLVNADVTNAARQANPSAVIIAACAPDQKSFETTNLGHGVFTYHLLEGLLGLAADHEGNVTAHSLYEVVSREMDSAEGVRQDPVFGGRVTGRFILGTGFTPVLAAPKPEQEYERIELEARELLEQYNHLRTSSADDWRENGYAAACRKLESISAWFARKEQIQGISQRPGFRQSKATLLRFQSELGVVEPGTKTRWGMLEKQIGVGGFGKVRLLRDEDGRRLAYKVYHANELSDREKVKRFRNGYDAMRMLNHPCIVNVHDYSDSPPGFVMDYIEGLNLRELALGSFMEPSAILSIMLQSAQAIEDAHRNVIHRDIKPENIVCKLEPDGTYKPYLTDFDLAWFSTQTQKATKTAMGVVYYAAPEQYVAFNPKAARERKPALDVYSFGQLLFFCITNSDPEPLSIDGNSEKLNRALLRSCPVGVASALIDLYRNCVQFDPGDRFQSFSEIIAILATAVQELTHTDSTGVISEEKYLSEVIFQISGKVPGDYLGSFSSVSGSWDIFPRWKAQTHARRGASRSILHLHFKPTTRVSLENASPDKMRAVLNRKISQAISSYGNQIQRHSGKQGEFEFFLEWHPKSMTRQDALTLCEAIRNALGSLQM